MFSHAGQSPIQMISRVIFGQGMSCLEACRKPRYERPFFMGPVPAPLRGQASPSTLAQLKTLHLLKMRIEA